MNVAAFSVEAQGPARAAAASRSGVYRQPRAANDNDLALMRRIDELFTCWAVFWLAVHHGDAGAEASPINRNRVQRLMRQMGIAALGPKPRTTNPAPGHKIYPYLLRDIAVERPNQVWCTEITGTSSKR